MASTASLDLVQKIYIAYYGRPADPLGQTYWADVIDAANGDVASVINAFGTSAEATAIYGNLPPQTAVNNLYKQLFGRDADVGGLKFYVDGLGKGDFTLASIALAIANGATGTDVTTLNAKIAAANAFTAAVDTTAEIIGYAGDAAAAAARAELATVVDANSSTTFVANVAAHVDNVVAVGTSGQGQTFALTEGVDNYQGTAGNDTIIAGEGSVGGVHTLGSSDVINGGNGTDTLQLRLAGTGAAVQVVVPQMSSVEVVNAQALGVGGANGINLINATGYTELNNVNSTNDLAVTNAGSKASIGVTKGIGSDYTVQYDAAAVTGAQDIVLDNADVGNLYFDSTGMGFGTGFATVNVNAKAGDSVVGNLQSGGDITTLNVTGAGSLEILAAANAGLKTIDASANKGGVDLNITLSNQAVTFTGGAGDDRINYGTTLNLLDKVDGGAGVNTLAVDSQVQIVSGLDVTNVQTLELRDLTGTLEAGRIAGVDTVHVTNTLFGTINGLTSGSTVISDVAGGVTVNVKDATVAGTADTLNLKSDLALDGTLWVEAPGVETINYTDLNAAKAGVSTSVNFWDTDGQVDLRVLNISNKAGNTAIFDNLNNTIKTVDASAAAGNVEVSIWAGNPTNGVNINGGAGNDNLIGGDGKDIIVAGAGNDSVSGDQYTVIPGTGGAAIAQVSSLTIANAEVGDVFNINGHNVVWSGVEATDNAAVIAAAATAGVTITADTNAVVTAGTFTMLGANTGAAFALPVVSATNVVAVPAGAEGSTVTITAGYVPDADDAIGFSINGVAFAGTAGQTVAQQTAAIVAAINVAGQMTATSAVVAGDTVITLTGNTVGQDYTIDTPVLGANATVAAAKQIDTVVLDSGAGGNADIAAGNIVQVTIDGTTVNYTITGTAATDANGLVNAINAAGLGVTAAFVDAAGAGLDVNGGDSLTLTADTAGVPFTATVKVNGAAPVEITSSTTTPNQVATSTQAPATEVVIADNHPSAAVPAGADTQTISAITTTIGQASADQYVAGAAAADTLTGGDGKDTFLFLSGSNGDNGTTFTTMDTITDLNLGGAAAITAVDHVVLNGNVFNTFGATDLINAGTPLAMTGPTLHAAVQALFNNGGALNGSQNDVGLFTYGSDTYLIATDNLAGLDANDVIVKVTGVTGTLDLSDIQLINA